MRRARYDTIKKMTGQKIIKGIGKTLLVLGGLLFLILYFGEKGKLNPSRISFAPRPGGELFRIFTGEGRFPKFTLALIEPRDVKLGDTQTLTVRVEDPAGVESVFAETELDHTTSRLPLRLAGGTATSGYWTNSWIVYDTHSKIYRTKFIAKNQQGETREIVLAWSDPCTPPLGGDWTVDASCSISGVTGADNGNINFTGAFTMTINTGATVVYNTAKQISLSTGSIALSGTAEIREANLFITDGDGDTRAPSSYSTTYSTAASLGGYVRRYAALSTSDCNDASTSVWQTLTCYVDADNDTYTTGGAVGVCKGSACNSPTGHQATQTTTDCNDASATVWVNRYTDADSDTYCPNSTLTCVGSQAGYRDSCTTFTDCDDTTSAKFQTLTCYLDSDSDGYTVGTGTGVCKGPSCASPADAYKALTTVDCCDTSGTTYPGQGGWFTGTNACGSWDYNCVSGTEYQYTTVGSDSTCGDNVLNYNTACGCGFGTVTAGWSGGNVASCGETRAYYSASCAAASCLRCGTEDGANYQPAYTNTTQGCH